MSGAEPQRASRGRSFGGPANPHLRKVEARFGPTAAAPLPVLDGVEVVFICFTNRSGSNFLCEALASSGRLNMGEELLNWPVILSAAEQAGHGTLHATLDAMLAPSVLDRRLVLKVGPMHLDLLRRAGMLDATLARARFVHITRADRLAQAISFEIARQTHTWQDVGSNVTTGVAGATFDRHRLNLAIEALCEADHQFSRFFAVHGIAPIDVRYERLVADPEAEIARIGPLIGIADLAFDPSRIRLRRQAREINDEWRTRYLGDA